MNEPVSRPNHVFAADSLKSDSAVVVKSEIAHVMTQNVQMADAVLEQISFLESRLANVLLPPAQVDQSDGAKPLSSGKTPMGSVLLQHNERLQLISGRLADLNQRIDL